MSDDTQNRLKAFLARNRSRINGPGADTSDISNAYFSGSSTKTDADKLDMIQNISHSTKFHENSNKTLAQSLDEKRSGREFEGVSFEYQPISLFDVIGNTPYSEAHDSTRNNSILQSEQVRVQGHDLYSVVNTSPGRQSDRNAEYESQLASFRRHENDVISNEEHNNAMANTNKPVSVSKSSKKDTVSGKKTSPSKDVKKETSSSPSGAKVQTNSQAVKDIKEQASNNKVEPEKPQQQQLQQQEQQPPVIEKVEEIKGRTGSMSFNGSIKGGSQVFEEAEPIVNYQPPKENKVVEVERRQNSPEIEKKKSVSPAKKVKEGNSGGSGEKVKGVFSESSKKLNALNDNTPNDSEFKKEIKNLIKVIKQEKEQVVEELKLMAEDLNKYKSAFKKLQKQKGTKPSDPGFSSPKRDSVENKKSFSPERQGPSSGNKSNRAASPSQKSPDKGGFENIQGLDLKDLISASELKKDPINEFVIKDMNLNPKLFFKDEERLATDPNIKPTIVDLVASQREIINFLVKRYQTAEHNRLKTEEQASKVVLSLENAVKKLDKKDSLSRTRTSLSPINSRRRVNMTDQI